MYLSKLELNPARRETRRLLANRQAMHAVVAKACASDSQQRTLWRLDDADSSVVLYLVSPEIPQLQELAHSAGWDDAQGLESVDYDPFLSRLEVGHKYGFRLTANPTHTVTKDGVKKRTAHVTSRHQQQWLLDRAEGLGFEVLESSLPDPTGERPHALELGVSERFTHTFRRAGKTVTLATATYRGRLVVTDPDRLRAALTSGIGKAKAYGCGLMTLALTS